MLVYNWGTSLTVVKAKLAVIHIVAVNELLCFERRMGPGEFMPPYEGRNRNEQLPYDLTGRRKIAPEKISG
jgi:hypothetical protein